MTATSFSARGLWVALLALATMLAMAAAGQRGALPDPLVTPVAARAVVGKGTTTGISRQGERLIAVGPRGLILRSGDGAKSWQQVASPVASDLASVRFTDADTVWAVGHDGVALRSRDGGAKWERVLDGRSLLALLRASYGERAKAGDAAAAAMLKEIERGVAQSATPDVLPSPFLDVWFADAKEGYLVGAFGMLLRTQDGGQTWQPMIERSDNERRFHLYAVGGQGDQRYIAGEQGLILRWDSATTRFVKIESPYIGSYFGLDVAPGRLVVYGLRGNAYLSDDGGSKWQKLDTGVDANLVALLRLSGGRLLLVSQAGDLLALDPGSLKAKALQSPVTGEVFGAVEGKSRSLVLAQIHGLRDVELLGIPLP